MLIGSEESIRLRCLELALNEASIRGTSFDVEARSREFVDIVFGQHQPSPPATAASENGDIVAARSALYEARFDNKDDPGSDVTFTREEEGGLYIEYTPSSGKSLGIWLDANDIRIVKELL